MFGFWNKKIKKEPIKKKVFVGVSGGVDSSVSAALLKKAGYDVTGVFLKVWYPPFLECNWQDEKRDAMRVCASLDIPFLMFDFESEYKKGVVDYMISEYEKGRTPNPDVACNKSIKFDSFFKKAKSLGADYIATGHYALRKELGNGEYGLFESKDKNKDQTYFLWTLKKDYLSSVLFPIGHLEKSKVREYAKDFNLPTFAKKDSQGLCFLGKIDMKDFLKNYMTVKEGNVLNEKGEVIGRHDGAFFYTVGQRHGFNIEAKNPDQKPLYIISKNMTDNTLVVSKDLRESVVDVKGVLIRETNWIREPQKNEVLHSRVRYRQKRFRSSVEIVKKDEAKVYFDEFEEALSIGQSLVVYNGEECLGGGVIEEVF